MAFLLLLDYSCSSPYLTLHLNLYCTILNRWTVEMPTCGRLSRLSKEIFRNTLVFLWIVLWVQAGRNMTQEWKGVVGLSACKAFEFGITRVGRSALLLRGSREGFLAAILKPIPFQVLRSYFPGLSKGLAIKALNLLCSIGKTLWWWWLLLLLLLFRAKNYTTKSICGPLKYSDFQILWHFTFIKGNVPMQYLGKQRKLLLSAISMITVVMSVVPLTQLLHDTSLLWSYLDA